MAFKPALTVKNTGRKHVCSMYKCTDNNTVMVHRGRHSSFESLFLCEDCVRELMDGYIDVVGEEKAKDVFASSIARLAVEEKPHIAPKETAESAENEEKPVKKGEKKSVNKGE